MERSVLHSNLIAWENRSSLRYSRGVQPVALRKRQKKTSSRHVDDFQQIPDFNRFFQMVVHVTDRISNQKFRNNRFLHCHCRTAKCHNNLHEYCHTAKVPAGTIRVQFFCQLTDFAGQRSTLCHAEAQQRLCHQLRCDRMVAVSTTGQRAAQLSIQIRIRQLMGIVDKVD